MTHIRNKAVEARNPATHIGHVFKAAGAMLLTTLFGLPAAMTVPVYASSGVLSVVAAATMVSFPAAAATVTSAAGPGNVIGVNEVVTSEHPNALAADYTAFPVLNVGAVPPLVMLVMSRDEQLFIQAYTDYTDLDDDGIIDTTYNNDFAYSGYFDGDLCYSYTGGLFTAASKATTHQCSGDWSGNFLNWVAMSRLDVVRFVLYGGLRSTDTATTTVLQRADIPNDLHAWAKVYAGSDVNLYTPFSYDAANPVSFCNATTSAGGVPEMRAARGNWSEWAATALRQCDWKDDASSGSDGSYKDVPSKESDGLGSDEYTVRIKVCDPSANAIRESFCRRYSSNGVDSYKPAGLLQRYGENGQMRFGLITGTFSAPRSGGVLRRNIGKLAGNGTDPANCTTQDEVKLSDGTFCNQGSGNEGIINTLNRLQLTQWDYTSVWKDCNTYSILNRQGSGQPSLIDPGDGSGNGSTKTSCSAWGNPLSEMYAEALRYIAADGSPTTSYNKGTDLSGLPKPGWIDPYGKDSSGTVRNPYCAACSIIVLSTGLNSFDSDELPTFSKIDIDAVAATKTVGEDEGINGQYLVGRVLSAQSDLAVGKPANTYEDLCSAKSVDDLSLVRGLCPDIPSMEGSYLISGLAYKAWTTDMRPGLKTPSGDDRPKICAGDGTDCADYKNTVQTYAVALAENMPKLRIPVGNSAITLSPLCQANNSGTANADTSGWRSCYLGTVGIGPKTSQIDTHYIYGRPLLEDNTAGSLSLVWEDSLWGNDHDNDVVSMLTYCVGATCERSTALPVGSTTAPKLCFYQDKNYNDDEYCPSVASADLPQAWRQSKQWYGSWYNDPKMSSLRVPSGYSVTLYSNTGQTGSSVTLTADTPKLSNVGFDDKAMSYSITGGPVPPVASPPTYAGYDICWQSDSPICTDSGGKPTVGANEVLVRTENLSAYAGNAMLTGYAITGSDKDGVKRLELRPGNSNGSVLTATIDPPGDWVKPQVVKYTLGDAGAKQLENPLYYAAKYGGFSEVSDSTGAIADKPCDATTTPACVNSNWDNLNNFTGQPGADGLPDTFFPVRNPAQLDARLSDVFNDILARSGSGTAAAVVANSANGIGLTYQALYQAQLQSKDATKTVAWTGTVLGFWTDSYGYLRSDANGNQQLDSYDVDPVIEFYYDQAETRTKVKIETMPANSDGSPVLVFDASKATVVQTSTDALKPVWSAQDALSSPDMDTTDQRSYLGDSANERYIFTWIDADHDGQVESGEQRPFVWGSSGFDSGNYRFLNTDSASGAEDIVDWIRGTEITDSSGVASPLWRSRTVDIDGDGVDEVMRLGDIVDSTPVVVGTPAEAFDLLYNDTSYGAFREHYRNRRQMVYVGANDGMVHAFNGGFYNAAEQKLQLQPTTAAGTPDGTITAQPLGSELWAYVPGNLLPHLRWLADPAYAHMFYVDGNPIAQDVKIFTADDDHPDGWGTVLIVPFRFGGGPISIPTDNGVGGGWQNSYSAYVVLDVTNPEKAPTLLAELTNTELVKDANGDTPSTDAHCGSATITVTCATLANVIQTYTSSVPAEAMFRDSTDGSPNKFFLFTGSGTTDNGGTGSEGGEAASTASLKIRAYDLSDLTKTTPSATPVRVFDFSGSGTGATNSFAGDLLAADYNLNGMADGLYFGSVKGSGTGDFGGSLWKIDFKYGGADDKTEDPNYLHWTQRQLISDLDLPVTAHVTVGVSDTGKPMVFAGSGRAFTKGDLSSKAAQKIVGFIDTELLKPGDVQAHTLPLAMSDLVDVSDVQVDTDNGVTGATDTSITTYSQLTDSFDQEDNLGWYITLQNHPLKADGSEDTTQDIAAERVVSSQALLGGVLLTSTFLPGTDACTDVGTSRLYGTNYKTGSADPSLAFFGTHSTGSGSSQRDVVNRSAELGAGLPAAPSLHVGDGSGPRKFRACVQTSTGAIICKDITTLKDVLSGEVSWREPLDQ